MTPKLWCAYIVALIAAVASLPATLLNAWAGLALAALAFGAMLVVAKKSGTTLRIKRRR